MASKFDITETEPIAPPGRFAITEAEPIAAIVPEEPSRFAVTEPGLGETTLRDPDRVRAVMDHIMFSGKSIEEAGPVLQSEIATLLIEGFEEQDEKRIDIENTMMLSFLFDLPFEDTLLLKPSMVKQLYGQQLGEISGSVVNKNIKEDIVQALKETPENLMIGTIGMAAATLEAIKFNAVAFMGGGIFPDDAILHQFEAITPSPEPSSTGFIFDSDKLDFIRRGPPLPGAIAAEAFGIVTRLPDIGAKIIRRKQRALQEEQIIAEIANAPITKMARLVTQAGVPSMAVAVGVSLLTGNPQIGSVILGQLAGGAEFQEQLEEGSSVRKALIIAGLVNAAEVGGEALVLPKLVRGLKEGISIRRGLTLIVENTLQEAVTGFNQEFLHVYGTETTKGTDPVLAAKKAFIAGYEAIPENAFVGGATAGLVDIAATPVNIMRGRKATRIEARRLLDSIAKQAKVDITEAEAPVAEVPAEAVITPEEAKAELEALPYKELQQQAKKAGIKANQKKEALIEQITEAEPAVEAVAEGKVAGKIKVFRGSTGVGLAKVSEKGVSFTTEESVAAEFAKDRGGQVEKLLLDKNAKLAKEGDITGFLTTSFNKQLRALEKGKEFTNTDVLQDVIAQLRDDGFDGIDFRDVSDELREAEGLFNIFKNEKEIFIINPDVISPIPRAKPLAAEGKVELFRGELVAEEKRIGAEFATEIGKQLKNTGVRIKPTSIGILRANWRGHWIDTDDTFTFYTNKIIGKEERIELEKALPNNIEVFTGGIRFPKVLAPPAAPERGELKPLPGETKDQFRARVRAATGIKVRPRAELPPPKPTKAEKAVIDAKKFNEQIKQHEAAVEGEAGVIDTEDVDEAGEPLGKTMTPQWYEANAKRYKKTILQKGTDLARQAVKDLDFLVGVISTRIRNISPEIGRRLLRHEFNVLTRTTEQKKRIEPYLKATTPRKLGKDFNEFDLAYKNSDGKKMRELAVKHGFTKELAEFRRVNDELFHAGNAVGFEINYLINHFHRSLKDTKGFLEHFQGRDDWSIVRSVIENKESQRGRVLTETERAAIVNTLLRGYTTSALSLATPGAAKERTVQEVTAEINQFYHSPADSALNYIEVMNEKIAAREFFGRQSKEITKLRAQQSALRTRLGKLARRKGRQPRADVDKEIRIGFLTTTLPDHISRAKEKFEEITERLERMGADDLSNTIGQYVIELVTNEEIKPSQEKELRDLLMSRFDPKGTHGLIGEIIPLTYIDVLSQVTNSLTQLEELALTFYDSPVGIIPAAIKAVLNISEITVEELGLTITGSQELTDVDARKILSTFLSITQFRRFDNFSKQTKINAALSKFQNQSKREGRRFNEKLQKVFGKETDQVVKDLKAGEITEDVKLLMFCNLLEVQPLAKTEVPEGYLRAGNLRIFYQLKTFMIKQFDFVRTEALQDMRNPVADPARFMRGFGRLMWLAFSLALFGAGRDLLVDFITGRPFDLSDSVIDTFLRRFFFSRFQYAKAMREGFGRAFLQGFVPATKTIDAITRDIVKVSKGDTKGMELWRSVPIAGEFYYWWFGRGREKAEKEVKKAKREAVRRKPLFTGTRD